MYPTPESSGNTEDHTPIQTRILKELRAFKEKEKLNPKDDVKSRMKFLALFDWIDTLLTETERDAVEDILVEYHDIFARHRMDVGMNTEFRVGITAQDDKAVYSRSLPMPIHLEDNLFVKFSLMHKNRIITNLPFLKKTQVPFLHRGNPTEKFASLWISGKSTPWLQMIILTRMTQSALCQMHHRTWQGNLYSASLIAFKPLTVCRWRTSGQWNLLAFNFATEVFDYRRLPQGLSRSMSAFSSFMREYLDPVVKADHYAQYVHDIIIAANNATDLTPNIRAVFHCICQAGLKLTIEKCVFGFRQVEFLGRPFSSGGYQHKLTRFKNSSAKWDSPNQRKLCSAIWGAWDLLHKLHSQEGWKAQSISQTLRSRSPHQHHLRIKRNLWFSKQALSDASEVALKQPIPGKQLVLMTDVSFRSTGYGLIIEDNPNQKIQLKRKTYALVAFGSKIFSPAQLKMSIFLNEL